MRSLVLFVTDSCNLGCTYCYQSRLKNHLEWSDVEPALEHWFEQSPDAVTVSFFGGEPLIYWDLVKRTIERSQALSREHDKPVAFAIATNATRMSDEIYDRFAEVGMRVQVSIDGPSHVHDQQRGRGTFVKVREAIDRLMSMPTVKLKTSTVITPVNVDRVAESLRFVWELGAVDSTLHFDLTNEWETEHFRMLKRGYAELVPDAMAFYDEHQYFPHSEFQLTPEHLFPFKCTLGQRTMVLKPDGYLYGCNYHAPEWRERALPERPPLAVSTLDELLEHGIESEFIKERFRAVNESPYQAPLEMRYTDSRKCSECPYLFRCAACHATTYSFNKDPLWVPESQCHTTELNYGFARLLDRVQKSREDMNRLIEEFVVDPMKFGQALEPSVVSLPVLQAAASCGDTCTSCL